MINLQRDQDHAQRRAGTQATSSGMQQQGDRHPLEHQSAHRETAFADFVLAGWNQGRP